MHGCIICPAIPFCKIIQALVDYITDSAELCRRVLPCFLQKFEDGLADFRITQAKKNFVLRWQVPTDRKLYSEYIDKIDKFEALIEIIDGVETHLEVSKYEQHYQYSYSDDLPLL